MKNRLQLSAGYLSKPVETGTHTTSKDNSFHKYMQIIIIKK